MEISITGNTISLIAYITSATYVQLSPHRKMQTTNWRAKPGTRLSPHWSKNDEISRLLLADGDARQAWGEVSEIAGQPGLSRAVRKALFFVSPVDHGFRLTNDEVWKPQRTIVLPTVAGRSSGDCHKRCHSQSDEELTSPPNTLHCNQLWADGSSCDNQWPIRRCSSSSKASSSCCHEEQ
jgi:hypothetical protein